MNSINIKLNHLSQENLLKGFQTDYWGTSKLMIELVLPRFTIGEIGITHRWITHWDKEGLIDNRREGVDWRRFSFVEYIWLRIIARLRDFNMPLSSIKQVKKFLFKGWNNEEIKELAESFILQIKQEIIPVPPGYTNENFEKNITRDFAKNKSIFPYFNSLFQILFSMLITKKPYCLAITDKGVCRQLIFEDEATIEASINAILKDIVENDFTIINIYRILEEFFDNEKIKEDVIEKVAFLSDKEKQVLELIRKGDFKELSIKLKSKKEYLVRIKRNKSIDTITNEVSSIINRNKYQEIKLITQKGKIVIAEITESIMI
jgi:DNA-binding transcriptional MerR regulator